MPSWFVALSFVWTLVIAVLGHMCVVNRRELRETQRVFLELFARQTEALKLHGEVTQTQTDILRDLVHR